MNWGLVLVPSGAAVLGLIVGFGFGRLGRRRLWARRTGYALALGLILCAIGFLITARANQGWDGLGYFIFAIFMALPAAIGAACGTWTGGR